MSSETVTELRSATQQDAAAIRDLVRAAYAKWVPVLGREPLPMQIEYGQAIGEHQFDLLHVDGAMIALIETMPRPDHLWIENVAVRPDSQGKGWGRYLLAHAERQAAAAGLGDIRLLTNAVFEANIALYQKLGYRIDRQEAFRGGITVYMSKRLGR